jgi:hypothetical protein
MGNKKTEKRKAQRQRQKDFDATQRRSDQRTIQKEREKLLIKQGILEHLTSTIRRKEQRKNSAPIPISLSEMLLQPVYGENEDRLEQAMRRILVPINEDIMTRIGRRSLLHFAPLVTEEHLAYPGLFRGAIPLIEHERKYMERLNPRSLYSPEILQEQYNNLKVVNRLSKSAHMQTLQEAAGNVKEYLNLQTLQVSPEASLSALLVKETETSASSPWYARRSFVAFPYLSDAWKSFDPVRTDKAEFAWRELGEPDILDYVGGKPYPYAINYRVEASSDPDTTKHRVVWAAPLPHQVLENQFALGIVHQLQVSYEGIDGRTMSQDEMIAGDEEHGGIFTYVPTALLYQSLMQMRSTSINYDTLMISLDYEQFDQHVSAELIEYAFDALAVPRTGDGLDVRRKFIYKKLHTPWGTGEFTGTVPSGSVFTNLVDSAVNAIIIEYVLLRADVNGYYRVNGDDSVLSTDTHIALHEIEELAGEISVLINQSKQMISRKEGFLFNNQYWGPEFQGPMPSLNKMQNSICRLDMVKADVPSSDNIELLRTMQVVELCQDHPMFPALMNTLVTAVGDDGRLLMDYNYRIPLGMQELSDVGFLPEESSMSLLERYAFVDNYLPAKLARAEPRKEEYKEKNNDEEENGLA